MIFVHGGSPRCGTGPERSEFRRTQRRPTATKTQLIQRDRSERGVQSTLLTSQRSKAQKRTTAIDRRRPGEVQIEAPRPPNSSGDAEALNQRFQKRPSDAAISVITAHHILRTSRVKQAQGEHKALLARIGPDTHAVSGKKPILASAELSFKKRG